MQRTFLYISCCCFALLQRKTSRNFLVTSGYLFYGGNVRILVHFFFFSLPLIFTLVAASTSHFLTAATKFSCCSSNKKCLLCFLSLALDLLALLPFFSLSFSGLPLFLCLSLALYSKCVDMTINLSLIL